MGSQTITFQHLTLKLTCEVHKLKVSTHSQLNKTTLHQATWLYSVVVAEEK